MNKKILFVKSRTSYPSSWIPILTDGENYCFGGTNVWIPVFDNYSDVQKAMYRIRKQMHDIDDLIFYTRNVLI